jgi:23S rRNA (cytidine2498-2'-O)-methyltransferase
MKLLPKGKGAANLPRIHLIMTSNKTVLVAFADVNNSNPWPMGIPRLRFPPNAPSRSTLKLEEAFHVFLGPERMKAELKSGMTSVDLGACPGGWTYQLVKHGMFVTAVDNGSIDSKLMSSGLVTHLREDAFTYRPYDTVDWMVCDVVEQPSKIADLMTDWLVKGYCRNTIFNLKLPMKKRFEEVDQCLTELKARCRAASKPVAIKAKQLYHDRKEITVFVSRDDA